MAAGRWRLQRRWHQRTRDQATARRTLRLFRAGLRVELEYASANCAESRWRLISFLESGGAAAPTRMGERCPCAFRLPSVNYAHQIGRASCAAGWQTLVHSRLGVSSILAEGRERCRMSTLGIDSQYCSLSQSVSRTMPATWGQDLHSYLEWQRRHGHEMEPTPTWGASVPYRR